MSSQSNMVTIPNIELSLDQLLAVIRRLDAPARIQVARVLLETKMDAEMANLIDQLARTPPADDVSDADIKREIEVVRGSHG
jgi:hypothetical protein